MAARPAIKADGSGARSVLGPRCVRTPLRYTVVRSTPRAVAMAAGECLAPRKAIVDAVDPRGFAT
jgi:hypothetical protein